MDTLGSLIDKLTIMNLKLWHQEDIKHDPDADDKTVANAARKIAILNKQRNDLIEEIDEVAILIGNGNPPKVYKQIKMY